MEIALMKGRTTKPKQRDHPDPEGARSRNKMANFCARKHGISEIELFTIGAKYGAVKRVDAGECQRPTAIQNNYITWFML